MLYLSRPQAFQALLDGKIIRLHLPDENVALTGQALYRATKKHVEYFCGGDQQWKPTDEGIDFLLFSDHAISIGADPLAPPPQPLIPASPPHERIVALEAERNEARDALTAADATVKSIAEHLSKTVAEHNATLEQLAEAKESLAEVTEDRNKSSRWFQEASRDLAATQKELHAIRPTLKAVESALSAAHQDIKERRHAALKLNEECDLLRQQVFNMRSVMLQIASDVSGKYELDGAQLARTLMDATPFPRVNPRVTINVTFGPADPTATVKKGSLYRDLPR